MPTRPLTSTASTRPSTPHHAMPAPRSPLLRRASQQHLVQGLVHWRGQDWCPRHRCLRRTPPQPMNLALPSRRCSRRRRPNPRLPRCHLPQRRRRLRRSYHRCRDRCLQLVQVLHLLAHTRRAGRPAGRPTRRPYRHGWMQCRRRLGCRRHCQCQDCRFQVRCQPQGRYQELQLVRRFQSLLRQASQPRRCHRRRQHRLPRHRRPVCRVNKSCLSGVAWL